MTTITHIINPYQSNNENDNSIQEITFASIDKAVEYSNKNVEVSIIAAVFEEDKNVVPQNYKLVELKESTKGFEGLSCDKKLPLINEILEIAQNNSNSEYIIYSNIDIGLMPQFYDAIREFIKQGHESFVINRRRVSEKYTDPSQLELIYSEVGELHNGFDCFVFPRKLIKDFVLGKICPGVPHIGNSLALNLMCFSSSFKLFTDKHLTFHIGFDLVKEWGSYNLRAHNKQEYLWIIRQINKKLRLENIPGSSYPLIKRHFVWLFNPNFHYPTMFKIDFNQRGNKRYPLPVKKPVGFYEWLQKKVKLDN